MSAARTERLLNLLTLLLNTRRPLSLREIREMEEFAAYHTTDPKSGERAFERDKAALLELGAPLRWIAPEEEEDEETGLGGYMIDRERYFLPELSLAPQEVALLSIAGAAAAAIPGFPGKAAVIRALAKLGFDVPEVGGAPTVAHAPVQTREPEKVGAIFETLQEAAAARHSVAIQYRSVQGESTDRRVDPYGLYYRQGVWYLVAHCHLRNAERTFHLGRIESAARVTGSGRKPVFEIPDDFDLSAHVQRRPWEYGHGAVTEVTIRLAERLVPAIPEIFGRRVAIKNVGDETHIHLSVTNAEALIAAILPFGAAAEVLAPASLRARIGAIYTELAARYGDDGEEWNDERH